jgi:hypothetical protein
MTAAMTYHVDDTQTHKVDPQAGLPPNQAPKLKISPPTRKEMVRVPS